MITPQGPASYYCARLTTLAHVLMQNGYASIPTKSAYEMSRYQLARSIVILYTNHTVMIQGADLDTPRQLFAKLMDAEQQTLPF